LVLIELRFPEEESDDPSERSCEHSQPNHPHAESDLVKDPTVPFCGVHEGMLFEGHFMGKGCSQEESKAY
jgi:hypothetical protein